MHQFVEQKLKIKTTAVMLATARQELNSVAPDFHFVRKLFNQED